MDKLEITKTDKELLISTNTNSNLITFEMYGTDYFGIVNSVNIDLDPKDIDKVIEFLAKYK